MFTETIDKIRLEMGLRCDLESMVNFYEHGGHAAKIIFNLKADGIGPFKFKMNTCEIFASRL